MHQPTELMIMLEELRLGRLRALCLHSNGITKSYENYSEYDDRSYYVLPTSANPLHRGHLHMANFVPTVRDTVDGEPVECEFELSMRNVDKEFTPPNEIHKRLMQFKYLGRTCWVTNFATFVQKSHFFHETQFVVGTDTANRVIDPAYYYDCKQERDKVLCDIDRNTCAFMVLGRPGYDLHPDYNDNGHMFFIEDYDGHDISSTEIRKAREVDLVSRPQIYVPVDQHEFGGATKPQH